MSPYEQVVANAAENFVKAFAAAHRVVAASPSEIVSIVAIQAIVARAAINLIVAAATENGVVASACENSFGFCAALDKVSRNPALDRTHGTLWRLSPPVVRVQGKFFVYARIVFCNATVARVFMGTLLEAGQATPSQSKTWPDKPRPRRDAKIDGECCNIGLVGQACAFAAFRARQPRAGQRR